MLRVFVAQHPMEAHLLKGLLESKGIACEIRGESLYSVRGEIPFTETFPELWVLDARQEGDALEVLRHRPVETDSADDDEPWLCAHCGQSVEPQFSTCWQCNTDRPE